MTQIHDAGPRASKRVQHDLAGSYARDGYAILPGAFSPAEVADLRGEALRICRGERGPVDGMLPGPPNEPDEAVIRRYACIHFPQVLPGSHRPGVIYPDRDQEDPRFDCTVEAYSFPYSDGDAVPVPIAAGSVLLFNGYLLHRSLPNTARSGLRRALVNHYMSAQSLLPWTRPPDDVHVAMWDCRDVVLVAGTDPYAWRGTADISRPHIRPEKDGGCHR